MKSTIILLSLFLTTWSAAGQDRKFYRVKKNPGKVTLTPHSNGNIVMYQVSGLFRNARKVIYLDTINGFQAEVPKNMDMQETNDLYIFCYTIPRENGRDNAICINSAPKSDYKTFENFKNHVIENPEYLGENQKSWLWNEDTKLISIDREVFNSFGSYKVLIQMKDRRLLGQFIILETDKSFLWLNFVADEGTFDSDIKKFSKFLKKFKILD